MDFILKFNSLDHKFVEDDLFLYNLRTIENYIKDSDFRPYILYSLIEKKIEFKSFLINKNGIHEIQKFILVDSDDIYFYLITTKEFSQEKQIVKEFALFYKISKSNSNNQVDCYLCPNLNSEIKISLLTHDKVSRLKKELFTIIQKETYINFLTIKTENINNINYHENKKFKRNENKLIFGILVIGAIGIVMLSQIGFNKK